MLIKANSGINNLSAYQLADLTVPAGQTLISLAQNELHFKPSPSVLESVKRAAMDSNRYPDADWSELTNSIACVHNINPRRILCGAGSMELLELLGRIYLSPNDAILMSEYGYSFFKTVAQMYCAKIDVAREVNYTADIDLLLEQVKSKTKIVFIANPGNPTGTLVPHAEIRRLRNELPDHILLIVDEAYAEFSDPAEYAALFDLIERNNTVILRTFSKIYGLAGMRVGWGYFPSDIHKLMRKTLNPNNISAVSQAGANAAMLEQHELSVRREQVNSVKAGFCTELEALGYTTVDSHSNFVLIDFNTEELADSVYLKLKSRGVILRPVKNYGLSHCLRATLSSPEHMAYATKVLKEFTEHKLS